MATDLNGVVHQYGPMVFGTAWRILGQPADAEDVVQDVFLEVHRSRKLRATNEWAGLLKRIDREKTVHNIEALAAFDAALGQ